MTYRITDTTLRLLVLDRSNPTKTRLEALESMQAPSIRFLVSLEAESQPPRLRLAAAKRRKAIEVSRVLDKGSKDILGL